MRFVDSNIFIYHLTAHASFGRRAKEIVFALEKEESCVSTFIVQQVCGYLKWRKRHLSIPLFLDYLASHMAIQKVETQFGDFVRARDFLEEHRAPLTSWDDLVIAAQMERLGISEIYSNDSDFDNIPDIKRIF